MQAYQLPASTWHWRPATPLPPASLPLKEKVGVLSLLGFGGVEVRVVLGGVVSTVQV